MGFLNTLREYTNELSACKDMTHLNDIKFRFTEFTKTLSKDEKASMALRILVIEETLQDIETQFNKPAMSFPELETLKSNIDRLNEIFLRSLAQPVPTLCNVRTLEDELRTHSNECYQHLQSYEEAGVSYLDMADPEQFKIMTATLNQTTLDLLTKYHLQQKNQITETDAVEKSIGYLKNCLSKFKANSNQHKKASLLLEQLEKLKTKYENTTISHEHYILLAEPIQDLIKKKTRKQQATENKPNNTPSPHVLLNHFPNNLMPQDKKNNNINEDEDIFSINSFN